MNEDTCPDSRDLIRRIALKKNCSKLEAIESDQRSRKSSVRELHSTVINNGFPYSNPTAQEHRNRRAIHRRGREIREAPPNTGGQAGQGAVARQRSARVVLDELVEGLGLRVRVLEHPEEVLEEDDLAADDGAAGLGGAAGAVDEGLEQRVGHELLGDEVPAARPADVDRVQALGHLVRGAVERRAPGVAAAATVVAVLAGRRRAGDAAGRVPPPDHAPELPQPALRHCPPSRSSSLDDGAGRGGGQRTPGAAASRDGDGGVGGGTGR